MENKNNSGIVLTDEQKQQAKEYIEDQMTKLGEVFSQCWESDEFRDAFIEDPKAIFEEYEIAYDKNANYKVFQTPDKTLVHILPYKGVKKAIKNFSDLMMRHVEDIDDEDEKQVLPEDWSWQIIQNTEDTYYIPIPLCPENLTPEELELVNGGCIVGLLIFVFQTATIATTTSVATEVVAVALADVLVFAEAVGAVAALAVGYAAYVTVVYQVANFTTMYTTDTSTGAWIFADTAVINEKASNAINNAFNNIGNDPLR